MKGSAATEVQLSHVHRAAEARGARWKGRDREACLEDTTRMKKLGTGRTFMATMFSWLQKCLRSLISRRIRFASTRSRNTLGTRLIATCSGGGGSKGR